MKTGNESSSSPVTTLFTSSADSPSPARTFTPTERQSELEALRQRGLTRQLNRHFNEQVAKETAAIQTALNHLKKRQQQSNHKSTNTTTTTSANREISPLDAVYLSITKWRRENREKKRETMLRNQRYAGQVDGDAVPQVDAKATSTDTKVDLPALEIPVSDAAKQIETVLHDYLKTGALELPSVESLGKDITFAQAYQEQYNNSIMAAQPGLERNSKEVDARCTPTANHISVYVGPGAFRDVSSDDSEANEDEMDLDRNLMETEGEMGTCHAVVTQADGSNVHTASPDTSDDVIDRIVLISLPQSISDQCSQNATNRMTDSKQSECNDDDTLDHSSWDRPPELIASTRSTDSTHSFSSTRKTKRTTTTTTPVRSTIPSSPKSFLCGVVVAVAVGMYYYLGAQQ